MTHVPHCVILTLSIAQTWSSGPNDLHYLPEEEGTFRNKHGQA